LPIYAPPTVSNDPSNPSGSKPPYSVIGVEHYSWKKLTTSVSGLMMGRLSIDHYGDMIVRNWRTGEQSVLTFRPKPMGTAANILGGWIRGSTRAKSGDEAEDKKEGECEVVGVIKDAKGIVRYELKGRWDEKLTAFPAAGSNIISVLSPTFPIWTRLPIPPRWSLNWYFTSFAITLNHCPESLKRIPPPSDSRLRLDELAMEEGRWDDANREKERLEMLQRERRKEFINRYTKNGIKSTPPNRNTTGITSTQQQNSLENDSSGCINDDLEIGEPWWVPRWFARAIDPDTQEEHWVFTGEYWKYRAKAVLGNGKYPDWVLDLNRGIQ